MPPNKKETEMTVAYAGTAVSAKSAVLDSAATGVPPSTVVTHLQ
jgi:hypothetical protein